MDGEFRSVLFHCQLSSLFVSLRNFNKNLMEMVCNRTQWNTKFLRWIHESLLSFENHRKDRLDQPNEWRGKLWISKPHFWLIFLSHQSISLWNFSNFQLSLWICDWLGDCVCDYRQIIYWIPFIFLLEFWWIIKNVRESDFIFHISNFFIFAVLYAVE